MTRIGKEMTTRSFQSRFDYVSANGLRLPGVPSTSHSVSEPWLLAAPAHSDPEGPIEIVLAVISTRNYLPFANVTATTFRKQHPDIPIALMVVDGKAEDVDAGVADYIFTVADILGNDVNWGVLKYNATQFCNAVKPHFLKRLSQFSRKCIYLDCDIAVFARMQTLLVALQDNALVLTPHLSHPFPDPERFWVHPNNADIFNSGLINAGCFGIRLDDTAEFLDFWAKMNMAPGAFFPPAGGQTDQQYLNWALVNCEGVYILKDPAYNVAYWNLHERNLRGGFLDGLKDGWAVDGAPLVCFHFSGYSLQEPFRLSRHDGRNNLYDLPSVSSLVDYYREAVSSFDESGSTSDPYRFSTLCNGVIVNDFVRDILKKWERYLPRYNGFDAAEVESLCLALMSPLYATGSLLPLLAYEVYEARADLRSAFPGAHLYPERLYGWFFRHAGPEYGISTLIDQFRCGLVCDPLVGFTEEVGECLAGVPNLAVLGKDRREASRRLESLGRGDLAASLLEARNEWVWRSNLSSIIQVYEQREDLRRSFAKIFGSDHEPFAAWLDAHGREEHGIHPEAVNEFRGKLWTFALARVFSFISRRSDLEVLAVSSLLSDQSEDLFRELIRCAGEGLEYDIGDVEVLMYLHRTDRFVLVPLYLELPANWRNRNSLRIPENARVMLRGQISDFDIEKGIELHQSFVDIGRAHIEQSVRDLVREGFKPQSVVLDRMRVNETSASIVKVMETARRIVRGRSQSLGLEPDAGYLVKPANSKRHLNLFGYHLANTGVGESTRGLRSALSHLAVVKALPFNTGNVVKGTFLHDLFWQYDYDSSMNVFVSYPHLRENLLEALPPEITSGRKNVAHLAWEQRDWHPYWFNVYQQYDEIWAISHFAAGPFTRMFGETRVRVVPNVVDFSDFPERSPGAANEGGRFRFLYVFDANSSLERKNPEGVLDAFVSAFAGTRDAKNVELYLKVGNLERIEHADRIARLRLTAQRSGLKIMFDGRVLTRGQLLELIASADCYVSLHRAEGFGYTLAEAMGLGVPVIATGYSGNMEFMNKENSYPVEYVEVPVSRGDGPFQRGSMWAEPSSAHAVALMRKVVRDRAAAVETGGRGKRDVRTSLSAAAVAQRMSTWFQL